MICISSSQLITGSVSICFPLGKISHKHKLDHAGADQLRETKRHAEPESQSIAEEDDHHGVAHAQADLEAIADTAW